MFTTNDESVTTNNESVYNKQWKCLQKTMKVFTTNDKSVYNK